jgi:hypothetical protein
LEKISASGLPCGLTPVDSWPEAVAKVIAAIKQLRKSFSSIRFFSSYQIMLQKCMYQVTHELQNCYKTIKFYLKRYLSTEGFMGLKNSVNYYKTVTNQEIKVLLPHLVGFFFYHQGTKSHQIHQKESIYWCSFWCSSLKIIIFNHLIHKNLRPNFLQ